MDKEEFILKTAMDVFVEKGWHGAKTQEIADRAGINKAMLHYYFRSKEKLYERILEIVLTKYFKQLNEIFKTEDDLELVLRSFIDKYLDILNKNSKVPLFMVRELAAGGKTINRVIKKCLEDGRLKFPAEFLRILQEEKDKGNIAEVDPVQFMLTLIGSCVYFFIAKPVFKAFLDQPVDLDSDAFLEQRKKALFNILYYGLKPRGEK